MTNQSRSLPLDFSSQESESEAGSASREYCPDFQSSESVEPPLPVTSKSEPI